VNLYGAEAAIWRCGEWPMPASTWAAGWRRRFCRLQDGQFLDAFRDKRDDGAAPQGERSPV